MNKLYHMSLYFIKTPKIVRLFFKNYLWKIDTDKKEIYLTFDDGPTPKVTEFVLKTLKTYNAKATFFCIGKNIIAHPKLFNQIINDGHGVGNHTQNHLNGWATKTKQYIHNIETAQKIIVNNHQDDKFQKLFRPPYGKIRKAQTKLLVKKNYKIVMWSILSGDFDSKISSKKCLENVLKNTSPGSIVVFHDSEKAFEKVKYVLPKVMKYFSNLGYVFKVV